MFMALGLDLGWTLSSCSSWGPKQLAPGVKGMPNSQQHSATCRVAGLEDIKVFK